MHQEPYNAELLPLNAIRTETVLSRFPIHRLAKRGTIDIEIRELNETGEIKIRWEVDYAHKLGQPGPLAYKVDTLIINRRIHETPKPLPKIIRLGSLRDICRELGLSEGKSKNDIKKALRQNAGAFITAKRTYRSNNGTEQTAEISDTRYGVIFTGEKFPDGNKADAVYVLLHDAYRDVLNAAQTRPLDYDYLKELSPGAQRFYELLSYQIFAALRNERPRAKMLYSYYCARAPQTRYLDYEHVKKQMYKVHAPHRKSDYISSVEFRETTDREGKLDWEMLYTPGRKARAEFRAFKKGSRTIDTISTSSKAKRGDRLQLPSTVQTKHNESETLLKHEPLVEKLKGFGVSETESKELVRSHRRAAEEQIAAYPYRHVGEGKKNLAGWIIAAIKNRYELPPAYLEAVAKAEEIKRSELKRKSVEECPLCNENGQRFAKSQEYPRGAIRRCSHNPEIEANFSST
jgi:hypothetical protein